MAAVNPWKERYEAQKRIVAALEAQIAAERAAFGKAIEVSEAARADQQRTIEKLLEARRPEPVPDQSEANLARWRAEMEVDAEEPPEGAEGTLEDLNDRIEDVWGARPIDPSKIVWPEGPEEAA